MTSWQEGGVLAEQMDAKIVTCRIYQLLRSSWSIRLAGAGRMLCTSKDRPDIFGPRFHDFTYDAAQ